VSVNSILKSRYRRDNFLLRTKILHTSYVPLTVNTNRNNYSKHKKELYVFIPKHARNKVIPRNVCSGNVSTHCFPVHYALWRSAEAYYSKTQNLNTFKTLPFGEIYCGFNFSDRSISFILYVEWFFNTPYTLLNYTVAVILLWFGKQNKVLFLWGPCHGSGG
jgi:hypothetical protein